MKSFHVFLMLMVSVLFSMVAGSAAAEYGMSGAAVGGVVFMGSLLPKPQGVLLSGINVEIWQYYITENLWKNNEFLQQSVDVSGMVLNGSVVHLPNAGSASKVVRNRTILPAVVHLRVDSDTTYALDEFTSDPVVILNAETVELSYDKLNSILNQDMNKLREELAEWMLWYWSRYVTTNKILTSGEAVDSHLIGTIDQRLRLTLADVEKLALKMDANSVPDRNRFLLLDAYMYSQLTKELGVTEYRDFSQIYNSTSGTINGQLYGFNIKKRATVLRSDGINILMPSAEISESDVAVALAWQADMVERAVGTIKMFERRDDPTMYGDTYSFLVRAGGRARRGDGLGVYTLEQATN